MAQNKYFNLIDNHKHLKEKGGGNSFCNFSGCVGLSQAKYNKNF